MDASHAQNAMTEIALALAMGFFCIMILAMLSMGVQAGKTAPAAAFDTAVLAPSLPQSRAHKAAPVSERPTIVIFHHNRYLSPDLSPADLGALRRGGPVILAVAPGLSMAEALKAQAGLAAEQVVLSTLSPEWQARLAHLPR